MKWYIKKSVQGFYVDFPEEIDKDYWEGEIGETYQDFLENKWILLSDEQLQFHNDNPNATIEEVLNTELNQWQQPSIEQHISDLKYRKLSELQRYDNSPAVNEFTINGKLRTWFTPEERSNYKNSIDSAKLLGVDNLQLLIRNQVIELATDKAAQLLAMIQLYADSCYMVTKQHEAAINALENVNDIEDYDFTVGYPKKLNFEL